MASLKSAAASGPFGMGICLSATAIAAWLNVAQMAVTLIRRGYYQPSGATVSRLLRLLSASMILGVFLGLASYFRMDVQPYLLGRKEIALALTVGIGGLLYLVLLFGLKAVTLAEVRGALRRQPKPAGVESVDLGS